MKNIKIEEEDAMDDFRFIEEALTFYFEKMDSDCLNYLEENSITY